MTDKTITRIALLAGSLLSGAIVFAYAQGKQDGAALVAVTGDEDVTDDTVSPADEPDSPSPGAPGENGTVSDVVSPLPTAHDDQSR